MGKFWVRQKHVQFINDKIVDMILNRVNIITVSIKLKIVTFKYYNPYNYF